MGAKGRQEFHHCPPLRGHSLCDFGQKMAPLGAHFPHLRDGKKGVGQIKPPTGQTNPQAAGANRPPESDSAGKLKLDIQGGSCVSLALVHLFRTLNKRLQGKGFDYIQPYLDYQRLRRRCFVDFLPVEVEWQERGGLERSVPPCNLEEAQDKKSCTSAGPGAWREMASPWRLHSTLAQMSPWPRGSEPWF